MELLNDGYDSVVASKPEFSWIWKETEKSNLLSVANKSVDPNIVIEYQ